jgi:acetyl esterase/lipase
VALVLVAAAAGAVGVVIGWSGSASVPPPLHADLAYGSDPAQVLDVWTPTPARQPAPLVIFIHGGGFSAGDKHDVGPKVTPLLSAGYAVASIDYRMAPRAIFPVAARDLRTAVRFLRSHAAQWRIDPDRFALWGESAGADLAALVAVVGDRPSVLDDPDPALDATSARVQAVVDWYGPIDLAQRAAQLRTRGSDCSDPQLAQADRYTTGYLGAEVERVPQRAAAANPMTYLRSAPSPPPFSIAHGTADCLVPVAQAENLAAALRAAGTCVDLRILRGAGHADPRFDRELLAPTITWLTTVLDGTDTL